jgi:hypothetical protein
MTSGPVAAFQLTAEAAQRAAGAVAGRHRGDFEGAETLLSEMDDHTRAAGCLFLADLAIALLAKVEGRSVDEVAAELSLQIAALSPEIGT